MTASNPLCVHEKAVASRFTHPGLLQFSPLPGIGRPARNKPETGTELWLEAASNVIITYSKAAHPSELIHAPGVKEQLAFEVI